MLKKTLYRQVRSPITLCQAQRYTTSGHSHRPVRVHSHSALITGLYHGVLSQGQPVAYNVGQVSSNLISRFLGGGLNHDANQGFSAGGT